MPARFLLIDGYNLLHAAGMGRQEYGPGELQRCRERLLRYLASKLSPAEIARATVVFDARDPPPDRPARQTVRGLKVVFANPGGDADVVIQDWLSDHSAPKGVTLVSSDHVLQRAARRSRSRFVDSEQFFDQLEGRRDRDGESGSGRHSHADAKPADGLSAAETAHWMRVFGDLSTIAERESAESLGQPEEGSRSATGGEEAKPRGTSRTRRRGKKSAVTNKRTSRVSADDVAYWMEVFGKLPEAQELSRGKAISQCDLERWLAEFDARKD